MTNAIITHTQHLQARLLCSSSFFDSFSSDPVFWWAILADFMTTSVSFLMILLAVRVCSKIPRLADGFSKANQRLAF